MPNNGKKHVRCLFRLWRRFYERPCQNLFVLGSYYHDSKKAARTVIEAETISELVDEFIDQSKTTEIKLTRLDELETIIRARVNRLSNYASEPVGGRELLEFRRIYNERIGD